MNETKDYGKYNINLDVKYNHLELVDVPHVVKGNKEKWFNQTLTQVNDSVVRIGIIEGEFHWHKHDDEDEFFFVLEGKLFIDVKEYGKEKTIELDPMQGTTITKGVLHKPRAPKKTVMLMFETGTIKPTGS
ncbi:MAG TPA: cupin domain-containing protein [Ignavibacteria bacterium]|nr:cupin domain-containing protein [Ignavibacteria bacterium]